MSGGWFTFTLALLIIAAVAAGHSTGKASTGIAVFAFGFALAIWADEIAGGDENRRKRQ